MNTTIISTTTLAGAMAVVLGMRPLGTANAQTLWLEEFDGGASTTGFWVDSTNVTDCRWVYAPDSVDGYSFSQDFGGFWPAGAGFDSSFVFLDSDACGGSSVVVDSYLYSAPFDATAVGTYKLHFSHQFRARLSSFCRIEVSPDGSTWTQVANFTSTDVGYPNPAAADSVDITTEAANSASTQVRFQFNAGWDWWWALDSISVTFAPDASAIDEHTEADRLHVFPNPVNDLLFVDRMVQGSDRLVVSDMFGRPVIEENMTRALEVGGLSTGTYTIELRNASGGVSARARFVKR